MNQINLLRQALKPHLGWHDARLNFLALFLVTLLRVKTVNLAEIATGFRNSINESFITFLESSSTSRKRYKIKPDS